VINCCLAKALHSLIAQPSACLSTEYGWFELEMHLQRLMLLTCGVRREVHGPQ
jgi:hypothetical protein